MLEFKVDEKSGVMDATIKGTLGETCCDLAAAINSIYWGLYDSDPRAAEFLAYFIRRAASDDDSPMFKVRQAGQSTIDLSGLLRVKGGPES